MDINKLRALQILDLKYSKYNKFNNLKYDTLISIIKYV